MRVVANERAIMKNSNRSDLQIKWSNRNSVSRQASAQDSVDTGWPVGTPEKPVSHEGIGLLEMINP